MFSRFISTRLTRAGSLSRSLLLCMGLVDELIAGIPVVALPLLRDRLGLSYTQVGLLFTAAALSSMLLEPLINLFSDRSSKKPWILCGLLILSITEIIAGNTSSYLLLMLAFIVSSPAGKAAISLSQAALIDATPGKESQTMTRWTLLSGIGDFLAQLVVIVFVALHLGWTELCWLATVCWLGAALLLTPLRFPVRAVAAKSDNSATEISLWASLREALHDPLLLRWAALSLIPTMLDEVFLGFVSLYLRDVLYLSVAGIALILTLQMLASFVGLFLLDRLLKGRGLNAVRLLTWLALGTLVGVLGLLFAHALWLVIVSLVVISCSCAGWYPLAKAEAYARRPASSGVVRTVISLGAPFEMALPGAIGLISASFGVLVGLGVLGLAPLLMLVLLPYRRARSN
ncbi:MAG: MFS transporter [Ktedonobacteraceae bacterium]